MHATMMVFREPSGRWCIIMSAVERRNVVQALFLQYLRLRRPRGRKCGERVHVIAKSKRIQQRATMFLLIWARVPDMWTTCGFGQPAEEGKHMHYENRKGPLACSFWEGILGMFTFQPPGCLAVWGKLREPRCQPYSRAR